MAIALWQRFSVCSRRSNDVLGVNPALYRPFRVTVGGGGDELKPLARVSAEEGAMASFPYQLATS